MYSAPTLDGSTEYCAARWPSGTPQFSLQRGEAPENLEHVCSLLLRPISTSSKSTFLKYFRCGLRLFEAFEIVLRDAGREIDLAEGFVVLYFIGRFAPVALRLSGLFSFISVILNPLVDLRFRPEEIIMNRGSLGFASAAGLTARGTTVRSAICNRLPRMTAAVAAHTLNGKTIPGPVQPASHNVLVKIAESPDTTSGGLILSGDAKEKPTYGEAVEVGPGRNYGNGVKIPMAVEKGDFVLYGKYGGTDVDYDGQKHTIVTQDDILCKLSGGEYSSSAVIPIFDRVLIKVDEAKEETMGGILVSKGAAEKSTSGKIVAMGEGRFMENGETEPAMFAVGDTVLYGQYAGTAVEFDGEDYMLVRTADIYAKY